MPVNNVISCNSEFPIVSVLCLFYAICVCTLLLNILLCCGTQNDKVMCLDSSVLFSPILCHLQHVLGSLPLSMFLSFSLYGCAAGCVCVGIMRSGYSWPLPWARLCLSLSALVCVCVCCSVLHWRTDLADSTFPLIYTQCTHVCTHSSLGIFCFTHTYNADLLFEMPPDTEISTSTASNAWPHLKIGMQSSSQQEYKDAGIKRDEERASEN